MSESNKLFPWECFHVIWEDQAESDEGKGRVNFWEIEPQEVKCFRFIIWRKRLIVKVNERETEL